MRIATLIVSAVLGLAGLGLVGAAVFAGPSAQPFSPAVAMATVGLRPLPTMSGEVTMKAAPAPAPAVTTPKGAEVDAGTAVADAGSKAGPAANPAVPANGAKPDAGVKPVQAPGPATPAGEATLNLQASDTADIYLDGKKLGTSPQLGVKVKVGPHKVRFDCYDAAGNTQAGAVKTVTVAVDQELDVPFQCPEAQ